MLVTGLAVFASMALATMLVVAIAVVGSVTVLPAVLAKLGDGIDRGRLPGARRRASRRAARPPRVGVWGRIAHAVTGRPVAALVVTVCVLGAIAVPAIDMQQSENVNSLPDHEPVVQAQHAIEAAFPGAPDNAELVVRADDLTSPAAKRRLEALGERARTVTDGRGDISVRVARPDSCHASVEFVVPYLTDSTLAWHGRGAGARARDRAPRRGHLAR